MTKVKILAAASLTLALACEDLGRLTPIAGEPCLLTKAGNVVTGEEATRLSCHLGSTYLSKQKDGTVVELCVGSSLPSLEVCDKPTLQANGLIESVDENCDGRVNNLFYTAFAPENPCQATQTGVCELSTWECVDGEMTCVWPENFYGPQYCTQLDTDCDGMIGGEDPDTILSGPEWQYWGPAGTEAYPPCRPGHLECFDGVEILRGQVLPTTEICTAPGGVPVNEDCDEFIDEDNNPDDSSQALLVSFDTSGSMSDKIYAVIDSLCQAAENASFSNSTVSVQLVGLTELHGNYIPEPYIAKLTDFVSFEEGCEELQNWLNFEGVSGGSELFPYAIWAANNITPSNVDISWPDSAERRVVIFSDEPPQSYDLELQQEINRLIYDCIDNQYTIGVFTDPDYDWIWSQIADGCGGWVESLSDDPFEMRAKFLTRLGAECTE